jgi:putative hemolysin
MKVFMNLTMSETENKIINTERYSVFEAVSKKEIESALKLRFEVFNVEMGCQKPTNDAGNLEFDEFDTYCRHLIVVENKTGKTVGTYRLNTIETAEKIEGFYSFSEFCLEDLPSEVLLQSVEIGRACILREHRNTKVLFLLWQGLADFLSINNKRYLFGCTSIFSVNPAIGSEAYKLLLNKGFLHKNLRISPRKNHIFIEEKQNNSEKPEIPSLFNLYLKIGAKICGYPTIDPIFKTTDFFVIFDVETLNEKYRKMFFND